MKFAKLQKNETALAHPEGCVFVSQGCVNLDWQAVTPKRTIDRVANKKRIHFHLMTNYVMLLYNDVSRVYTQSIYEYTKKLLFFEFCVFA